MQGLLPLAGLRVLDLTMLLPGPLCTMLLADWGAEVIKVEPRRGGDALRSGPVPVEGTSAYFLGLNRNKKSLAVDLRSDAGREIVLKLAAKADAFVEGFRPGKAAKLGFGCDVLRAVNPRLVYCSLSGYGQTGPLADHGGHDLNYLALSGVLSLLGEAGGPPLPPGLPFADIAGALMAASAILAALLGRERSGEGAYLDVSLYGSSHYWLAPLVSALELAGVRAQRGRTGLTGAWPCYGIYATRDGRHMSLAALEPFFWDEFCRRVGHEEWLPLGRAEGEAGERLRGEIAALFVTRTQAEWVAFFGGADVCCEPVLEIDQARAHPQSAAQGLAGGDLPGQVGAAPNGMLRTPPPRLGEHTAEVLVGLGYTAGEIRTLADGRVVGL